MTLQAIRDVRKTGLKPGVVFVVIGDIAPPMDEFRVVVVRPTDDPERMDWRPMLGLTAAVFVLGSFSLLATAVLDALQPLRVDLFGVASADDAGPVFTVSNESHERLLRRAWELLCRC